VDWNKKLRTKRVDKSASKVVAMAQVLQNVVG